MVNSRLLSMVVMITVRLFAVCTSGCRASLKTDTAIYYSISNMSIRRSNGIKPLRSYIGERPVCASQLCMSSGDRATEVTLLARQTINWRRQSSASRWMTEQPHANVSCLCAGHATNTVQTTKSLLTSLLSVVVLSRRFRTSPLIASCLPISFQSSRFSLIFDFIPFYTLSSPASLFVR